MNVLNSLQQLIRSRRVAIMIASAGLIVACNSGSQGTNTGTSTTRVAFAPAAETDPFYMQPAQIPDVPPGTVLKSKAVTFAPGGIPQPNKAWLLQYMTRDVNDRPLVAVAAVVQPLQPSSTGIKPLVAYQFAYDSLGNSCVPSRTVTGDHSNTYNELESPEFQVAQALSGPMSGLENQGWTLVFADYEGPYHAYGAGKLSGQATLDAIRAALAFEPLGLSADTPVGMWGYSGGALASTWAASLQPKYAPEINLVAVAAGGTAVDVFGVTKYTENTSNFGLLFTLLVGLNRAYPELFPEGLLNAEGLRIAEASKDGCHGATTDGSASASGRLANYTTVADPYATPGALSVLGKTILPQPDHHPSTNLYIYHEIMDELVPIGPADAMVEAWCARGVHISYYRNPVGTHISGAVSGALVAGDYLINRLNGSSDDVFLPTTVTCN